MQARSLPSENANLTFDVVVPQSTSTRHVAASAFYHCLGLFDLCGRELMRPSGALPFLNMSHVD
jgi:hypothetical protein